MNRRNEPSGQSSYGGQPPERYPQQEWSPDDYRFGQRYRADRPAAEGSYEPRRGLQDDDTGRYGGHHERPYGRGFSEPQESYGQPGGSRAYGGERGGTYGGFGDQDDYEQRGYERPRSVRGQREPWGHGEYAAEQEQYGAGGGPRGGSHYGGGEYGRQGRYAQPGTRSQRGFGHSGYDDDYLSDSPRYRSGRQGGEYQEYQGDWGMPGRSYESRQGGMGSRAGGQWPEGDYGRGGSRSMSGGYASGQTPGQPGQQGFSGRGPKGYTRSDERLKEDICERLTDDPQIDASNVSVDVSGGKVTLSGQVEQRWIKHHVENIVDRCSGVQDIDNRLGVSKASRSGSSSMTGATGGGNGGVSGSSGNGNGGSSSGGESRKK